MRGTEGQMMTIDFGENIMNVLLFGGVIMSVMLVIAIVIIGYGFMQMRKMQKEFDEQWRKFK